MPARPLQPFDAGLLASSFRFSLVVVALLATATEPAAVEGTDALDVDAVECLRVFRLDVITTRWVGLDVCESHRTEAHQGATRPRPNAKLPP